MHPEEPRGKATRPESMSLESVLTSEGFASQNQQYTEAAEKALKDRPSFSLRSRLILAFSVCFLLPLIINLWVISVLAEVNDKIQFLEVADDYKVELQQARRFEKNYLLYGTNLSDARGHIQVAQRLSRRHEESFRRVLGRDALDGMVRQLNDYLRLLDAIGEGERAQYESELRESGSAMLKTAQTFVTKERRQVQTMLTLARRVPFVFLGVLLVMILVVATFLARQLLRTLNRFIGYTERIAAGDFTPILPARKYRDEFSKLALYINRMVLALERQHRILVESHKLRAMGTLVAGVAHELNNPMNNILLTASVLQDEYQGLNDEEKLEMIGDVIGQAERTKKIVANLLDFARESETKVEPLNLGRLMEETLRLVANQLRLKKVRLINDLPAEMPPVHGDRQLLSQAFMNLIINALDVLPEKGIIHIHEGGQRREGFLAVSISDNGPGIPDHILDRIFDPFFTTKPQGQGTGLGLSVTRGIVRKLGGYLLVTSRTGEGTTFTVQLPITTIPSEVSSKASKSNFPGPSGHGD